MGYTEYINAATAPTQFPPVSLPVMNIRGMHPILMRADKLRKHASLDPNILFHSFNKV